MMTLFEWLGYIVQEMFPPWVLCPKTHRAVRERALPLPAGVKQYLAQNITFVLPGGKLLRFPSNGVVVRDCGFGFVFKIPFIDRVTQVPVEPVSHDLDEQSVESGDGVVYEVSAVIRWCVNKRSIIKAVTQVDDYELSLKNEVMAALAEWVNSQEAPVPVRRLREEVTARVQEFGTDWGCQVYEVSVNSMARPWSQQELRHVLPEISLLARMGLNDS